jgi:hypothetical protein
LSFLYEDAEEKKCAAGKALIRRCEETRNALGKICE